MFNMSAKRKAPESTGTPTNCGHKVLTLEEKVSVLDAIENGQSHRAVALQSQCGHTQVNEIIKHKQTSRTAYQEGMNGDIKYLVPGNMQYAEIEWNKLMGLFLHELF